ncbi:Uncharacterised protein [uncultured archaeon]|nr:Uncharacterised protein [uncultured archaeon]
MNIQGNTPIIVQGKLTRVNGREFNRALKAAEAAGVELVVFYGMEQDAKLIPSKGLGWGNVSEFIRQGKKVVAKLEQPKAKK